MPDRREMSLFIKTYTSMLKLYQRFKNTESRIAAHSPSSMYFLPDRYTMDKRNNKKIILLISHI